MSVWVPVKKTKMRSVCKCLVAIAVADPNFLQNIVTGNKYDNETKREKAEWTSRGNEQP